MTHDHQIEAYKQLMATKGISSATAAPPLWNLLWSCGVPIPPPLFIGFVPMFLLCGSGFGTLFASFAWIMGNRGIRTMSLDEAGMVALITGAAFGLAVAWYSRRLARKHGLGEWSELCAGLQRAERLQRAR